MNNDELDEEMLDDVAGGGAIWEWVKGKLKKWYDKRCEKNTKDIGNLIDKMRK